MTATITRLAAAGDAAAVAAIFREGIDDRVATFETEPPSAAEVADEIAAPLPMLVAERDGQVLEEPRPPRWCVEGRARAREAAR